MFQIITPACLADRLLISTLNISTSQHVDRTHRDGLRGQWLDQGEQAEETVYSHLAGTVIVKARKSTHL